MKDNEIISLFEIRDEHAIEALSDSIILTAIRLPGICLQIKKIRKNA